MIHVSKGDVRKGLGVGREMGEVELEEGEALYFGNNTNSGCNDDSIIDPDIALSYIDEKLQHVLGHFQKDFEGGVSAENLGSKFGGYGSFLPTYQRSPPAPDIKTAPEVHSNIRPRSPNLTHFEGGRQNSFISSNTSVSTKSRPTSTNSLLVPASRVPAPNPEINSCIPPTRPEEHASICRTLKKPDEHSDLKSLKVRIRVGSENLSTTKNAELYSGLGLDASPSSSLDNSPTDSQGLSHDIQDAPDESPTSILQIMTSFPMHGGLLLSPLSDDLVNLKKKDRHWRKSGSKHMHKTNSETSGPLLNGSDGTRGSKKILGERKQSLHEKDVIGSGYGSDNHNCVGVSSNRESSHGNLACEESLSQTLKQPLLSNSYSSVSQMTVGPKKNDNLTANVRGSVKEKSIGHTTKEDLEPVSSTEKNDRMMKSHGIIISSARGSGSEKANNTECGPSFSMKEGSDCVEHNKDTDVPNINTDSVLKPSVAPKLTSNNEAGTRLVKKQVSSGGKKKSRGTRIHDAYEGKILKDGLVTDSSLAHKTRRSSSGSTGRSRSESKSVKNHFKARDAYAEVFGSLEVEQEDDKSCSERTQSPEMLKGSDVICENNVVEFSDAEKVVSEALEGEKQFAPTQHTSLVSNMRTITGTEHKPISASMAEAPVVKEDWVMCDKCQTWRLLPLGTDPESLPKKWHCKMLHWLPGLNRCGISEEETTKALRALYQFPTAVVTMSTSETQTHNQNDYPDRNLSGVASFNVSRSGLENKNIGLQVSDASGKKKHGSKDSSSESKQAGLMQSLSKINHSKGISNGSFNDSVHSHAVENGHKKHSRHLSISEKQSNKSKERRQVLDSSPSDGGAKSTKTKNKSETDLVNSRASKKVKSDGLYYDNENWTVGTAGENTGHSSSSGMAKTMSMKDRHKYKDSKASDNDPHIRNPVNSSDGSLHGRKSDSKDSSKKRKFNDHCRSETYSKSVPGLDSKFQDSIDLHEETCENGQRKEKAARVSKSEVKESSGNKSNDGKDDKGIIKDHEIRHDQVMDSSKRPLGTLQPSMMATSSSSKVSGSQRNKSNLQELRASPVESVSSSPPRIPTAVGESGKGSYQSGIEMDRTWNDVHNASHDRQDVLSGHIPSVKNPDTVSSVIEADDENKIVGTLPQCDQNVFITHKMEQGKDEGRRNDGHLHDNSGTTKKKKSGKSLSSKPRDKSKSYKYEVDSFTVNDSLEKMPSGENIRAVRNKSLEKTANHSDTLAKDHNDTLVNENHKEIHSKLVGNNARDVKVEIVSGLDKEQGPVPNSGDERSFKNPISDGTNEAPTSGKAKSLQPLPSRSQNETSTRLQSIPGSQKEPAKLLSADECEDDASRARHGKKDQIQSSDRPSTLRHSTPILNKARDLDAPSPIRKDTPNQAAANAVKEATNLKHLADRLKNSGSSDSTGLYFQAALKFLTGAALFELCSTESMKQIEMTQSGQIYSSTAKLCEFCAHEYERSKDMAAAALAYKCMEVAYMRVIYSSHSNANRYRNELQAALQIFPPGESPSSSASDIDNLNNPPVVDKGGLAKSVGSPQVTGAHVLTTRNRSNFTRLLKFAQEVSFAMEASKKSRAAFAAATLKIGENEQSKDGISSVKRALDFNFQDMDGLLRLVRVAMEEINR
ncbi:unnamed protein product [Cuscuta campestris]|uniref:CW-type domain-containing protein n=1 Tax=Cuscuta campestris TaxID=132261 RepID=A0A484KCT1_9ASTE|nr:unnamed protein product [Cuscuta campestris]